MLILQIFMALVLFKFVNEIEFKDEYDTDYMDCFRIDD